MTIQTVLPIPAGTIFDSLQDLVDKGWAVHTGGTITGRFQAANPAKLQEPKKEPPPPVDRSKVELVSGSPITNGTHTELRPDGQQKDYVVLSPEERSKGFVRPVWLSYTHTKCGTVTKMSRHIAETYARDPFFYSGTFCVHCGAHFPVGEDGEFEWADGTKVGT